MAGGGRQARQEAARWLAAQSARLEGKTQRPDADALVIDADCADAARVFLGMQTQWRVEQVGGLQSSFRMRSGLDYAALTVVAAAHGVAVCPGLLADLQEMELETRAVDLELARKGAS